MGFLMDTTATTPHGEKKRKNAKWNVSQAWIFRRTDVGEKKQGNDDVEKKYFCEAPTHKQANLVSTETIFGRFYFRSTIVRFTFNYIWLPMSIARMGEAKTGNAVEQPMLMVT